MMPVIFRNGDSIYYEFTETSIKKDTVIFIHGVGLEHLCWETFVPFFKKHYNILRYDLRGHGNSDIGAKVISWETFYEDLLFLVQTLNIQSFHLIGHGFGCNVATRFALINPDIVKSLILLSFAAVYPTSAARKLGESRKAQYQKESMVSVGEQVIEFSTRLPRNSEQFQQLLASYSKVSPEVYFNIYELMMQSKSADYLQHIHVPSLIIAGELDPIYPTFLANITPTCLATVLFFTLVNVFSFSKTFTNMIDAVMPVVAVMLGQMAYEFAFKALKGLGKILGILFLVLSFILLNIVSIHPAIVILVFIVYGAFHFRIKDRVS